MKINIYPPIFSSEVEKIKEDIHKIHIFQKFQITGVRSSKLQVLTYGVKIGNIFKLIFHDD